jgi:hypothetical protein
MMAHRPSGDTNVDLSVFPATVVLAGQQVRGAFLVVTEPVYRRAWWSFQETTFDPGATAASLADRFEQTHLVYSTNDRLLVLSATNAKLLIGTGEHSYADDTAVASVVRSSFDARVGSLHRGGIGVDDYDFYDVEVNLWSAVGRDFFMDPDRANGRVAPIEVKSVRWVDDHWEITVSGWIKGQQAVVRLSANFEVIGASRFLQGTRD